MMDLEEPSTFDNGYYKSLSPQDKGRFGDEFKNNLGDFSSESIVRELKTNFDKKSEHLNLLKAISACFHVREGPATDTGFKFYGVNPLWGTTETEADAILINSEHNCVYFLLVFCEIGAERQGEWVKNVNEAHRFFSQNHAKQVLKDKLTANRRDIEIGYVTLTRDDDATDVDFAVLNKSCNASPYSVWGCDTDDRWIQYVDGSSLHPDLRSEFSSKVDYLARKEPINFAVNTHPIFPLKAILFNILLENQTFGAEYLDEFNFGDFYDYFKSELKVFCDPDNEENVIRGEAKRVLQEAERSRIVTTQKSELESGEYKVVYSGTRGPEHARDAIKERYLKYMPEYVAGQRAFEKTKDEFARTPGLGDFN